MSAAIESRTRSFWREYLGERTGTYHFRCRRYAAVWRMMHRLYDDQLVYDVGAGMCEFGRYLYQLGWSGQYVPVDGSIDGTDLEHWMPPARVDWFVAIEVIEHLHNADRLLKRMENLCDRGVVITTPNAEEVDVLALDRTHVQAFTPEYFEARNYDVSVLSLFGREKDTIVARWTP